MNSEKKYECDKSFDEAIVASKFINFYPFVGKDYAKSKVKIMVLGDSHYHWDRKINEERYLTRRLILEDYLPKICPNGTHPYRHIRDLRYTAAMIKGDGYRHSDAIWDNLVFYNFFQKIVGKNPKAKKTIPPELKEESAKAFLEVFKIIMPDLIIAWGEDVKSCLPKDDKQWADHPDFKENLFSYESVPNTKIWHIQHPSRGFPYRTWRKKFENLSDVLGLSIG